jgi:DNA-binding beta-propeller fold protein YncE
MTTPRSTARARRATLAALSAGALGAGVLGVSAAPAGAGNGPARSLTLTPMGSYASGLYDEGAAEITAFDPATRRIFAVNAADGTVDVLDAADPSSLVKVGALQTPGANSVAIRDGLVAVAQQAGTATDPGTVAFFDAATLTPLSSVTVGALPDMVTFSPDGRYAVVAGEGEPEGYEPGQADPQGTVAVIDVSDGAPAQADVRIAGFTAWDGREQQLRDQGIRIYGPGASTSQDLEPEYVAVDRTSRTAWVTLQENNAVAKVDLRSATVTTLTSLGEKDLSLAGNGIDASDRDGAIAIRSWPPSALFEPDAVAAYAVRGDTYLVMANEGDTRDYDGFNEEKRVSALRLAPSVFPDAATLQRPATLGRLTATTTSPTDATGAVTRIQVPGARSVSVRDSSGRLLWHSGDALERITAAALPDDFNSDNAENDSLDSRSDNKGPEPEGVAVGKVQGRTYAFVGLERVGGIAVFDVSDPAAGRFVTYVNPRDFSGDVETGTAGDSGPEGITFVAAEDSPTARPMLVVGNEVSGTTTTYDVTGR